MYKRILLFSLFFISFSALKAQSWEAQATGILPPGYGVFSVSVVDDMNAWAVAFDQTIGSNIPNDHLIKVLVQAPIIFNYKMAKNESIIN